MDKQNQLLTQNQLAALSSIVEIGSALFYDLVESKHPIFGHSFCSDIRNRLHTKLVQIQCELESHESGFPFDYHQRQFAFGQFIPELRSDNIVLHIARSSSPNILPSASRYKVELSFCNSQLHRQLYFDFGKPELIKETPIYGLLVFGGQDEHFSVIQLPEPGYTGIIDIIAVPKFKIHGIYEDPETFARKKAVLKREVLSQISQEGVI